MPIVSFLNQKGGAGKTTLSVNTTREFILRGKKALLIDTDPQGSALDWHERSNGDLIDIVCLSKTTLSKDAHKFRPAYDWIFIDGIGKIESMMISAITCSDIVLIPVQPSSYDIWATRKVVELIKERQALAFDQPKAAFIINRKITGTKLSIKVRSQLEEFGFPIFTNTTCQRVAFADCIDLGLTVLDSGASVAADEIKKIATELEEFANGIN